MLTNISYENRWAELAWRNKIIAQQGGSIFPKLDFMFGSMNEAKPPNYASTKIKLYNKKLEQICKNYSILL